MVTIIPSAIMKASNIPVFKIPKLIVNRMRITAPGQGIIPMDKATGKKLRLPVLSFSVS